MKSIDRLFRGLLIFSFFIIFLALGQAKAGNGEGYNGPNLQGDAIPVAVDHELSWQDLCEAVKTCSGDLLSSVWEQVSGTPRNTDNMGLKLNCKTSRDSEWLVMAPAGSLAADGKTVLLNQSDKPLSEVDAFLIDAGKSSETKLYTQIPRVYFKKLVKDVNYDEFGNAVSSTQAVSNIRISVWEGKYDTALPLEYRNTRVPSAFSVNSIEYADCLFGELAGRIPSPQVAPPPSCSIFERYHEVLKHQPVAGAGPGQWGEYQQQLWKELRFAADRTIGLYFRSSYREDLKELVPGCIQDRRDRQRFWNELQTLFLERSYDMLTRAQSLSLRTLSDYLKSHPPLFRLTGHFNSGDLPFDQMGGFHRGKRSIVMDFDKIPPNEWLVIFIHEVAHNLDDQMTSAMETYSDKGFVKKISEWNRITHDPAHLRESDRQLLEQWVLAGLQRGLLTEWRAWAVTFRAYQDGLAEGLWERIGWIDAILGQKPEGMDLKTFTLRYLDSRFRTPEKGLFRLPLVANALRQIRLELSAGRRDISFGQLDAVVSTE